MSRPPSTETQLKTARRIINDLKQENLRILNDRDRYKSLATHAQRELEDWKRRFDALLKIVPEAP